MSSRCNSCGTDRLPLRTCAPLGWSIVVLCDQCYGGHVVAPLDRSHARIDLVGPAAGCHCTVAGYGWVPIPGPIPASTAGKWGYCPGCADAQKAINNLNGRLDAIREERDRAEGAAKELTVVRASLVEAKEQYERLTNRFNGVVEQRDEARRDANRLLGERDAARSDVIRATEAWQMRVRELVAEGALALQQRDRAEALLLAARNIDDDVVAFLTEVSARSAPSKSAVGRREF